MVIGWLLLGWLHAVAGAQEAVEVDEGTPAAEAVDDPASIEVIVYEELLVEKARQAVYEDLQEAGYSEVVKKDDKSIFRHPDPWKGEVHVYDDGWMRIKRQKIQLEGREMPWAERNSPLAWAGCVVWMPLCVRPGGQVISKNKFQYIEARITQWSQPGVEAWGERIADLSTVQKVDGLPELLEALWEEGTPLQEGDPVLQSHGSRRAALMAYWGSRTDTAWGERVRQAVEAFCRGVVQHSEHPFTDEEIAAFNAGRPDSPPFDLERKPIPEGP